MTHKKNIILIILVTLLLFGTTLNADETEKQSADLKEPARVIAESKPDQENRESDKQPSTFTPTEEVSADQAVAFPTDI